MASSWIVQHQPPVTAAEPRKPHDPLSSMMNQLDFERARQYALQRLERELAPTLIYHSLAHTRDEVAPAAEQLAAMEGVTGQVLVLVSTAAYFHDLGFVEPSSNHEAASARIAADVLPGFGYHSEQIQAVRGMILATRIPQSPHTLLEQIMADADLEVLGREDFMVRNQALRAELAASGKSMTDAQWYTGQLKFMRSHHYWTVGARMLRDSLKQENIKVMVRQLAQSQARSH